MSQADHVETLDTPMPVYLPGQSRDWHRYSGIAKISKTGDIVIKLMDKRAAVGLIDMALEKNLLAVSFDYKLSEKQVEELNQRYTKKIVSRVGAHPIQADGKDVGTAYFFTDGTIQVKLDGNDLTYTIDSTQKKDV